MRSLAFARKKPEERAHRRVSAAKALEAPGAEAPLPDRARVHEIMLALWGHDGAFERDALLSILERVPFTWGPWRAMKRIFKEAEVRGDREVLGLLTARIDAVHASGQPHVAEISKKTRAACPRARPPAPRSPTRSACGSIGGSPGSPSGSGGATRATRTI